MAQPVFSVELAATGIMVTTDVDFGPPPAGKTWVVRDISFFNFRPVPQLTSGCLVGKGAADIIAAVAQSAAFPGGKWHWSGRQIIGPGETGHIIAADVGFWNVVIMGYELTLP